MSDVLVVAATSLILGLGIWVVATQAHNAGLRQGSCNVSCGEKADSVRIVGKRLRCICPIKNEIKYLDWRSE